MTANFERYTEEEVQAMGFNPCQGCGNDIGVEEPPNAEHCPKCPPWVCDGCGQACSIAALCPCWESVEDMSPADIKALFADDCDDLGLSVDIELRNP